jgi:hypothetical protein
MRPIRPLSVCLSVSQSPPSSSFPTVPPRPARVGGLEALAADGVVGGELHQHGTGAARGEVCRGLVAQRAGQRRDLVVPRAVIPMVEPHPVELLAERAGQGQSKVSPRSVQGQSKVSQTSRCWKRYPQRLPMLAAFSHEKLLWCWSRDGVVGDGVGGFGGSCHRMHSHSEQHHHPPPPPHTCSSVCSFWKESATCSLAWGQWMVQVHEVLPSCEPEPWPSLGW